MDTATHSARPDSSTASSLWSQKRARRDLLVLGVIATVLLIAVYYLDLNELVDHWSDRHHWFRIGLNEVLFVSGILSIGFAVFSLRRWRELCAEMAKSGQTTCKLLESEERFRQLAENIQQVFWMVSPDCSQVLYVSPAYEAIWGRPSSDLYTNPKAWFESIHVDDHEQVASALTGLGTGHYATEYRIVRPDGSIRWISDRGFPIRDASGRVYRVVGVADDVTKRKETEEQLGLRDRAIDAIEQGIVITDPNLPDNPVIYVNQAFERLTGYSQSDVVGKNCRFLQAPDADPTAIQTLRTAIRERRPCVVQLVNRRKDGSTFWNSLAVSPVCDAKGRLQYFVGVQTDITSVKKLEEQLRQAQKMDAVGRLAGGVAHDFNNILTAIIGYCELTREQLADLPDALANIEEIAAAAERAASLTHQLLAFSRKQTLLPRVLDLNTVVRNMDKMLHRLIGEDIELVSRLASVLDSVKVDPGQIEQVIMNLAINARDAMPKGGTLIIETENASLHEDYARLHEDLKPGEYVMLAVTDTGVGMTDEVKARLFEPFFTTKPQGQGTGLGLATCYGVIKQSGGHITVYSEPNCGTTFRVYLPRVSESTSANPTPSAVAIERGGSETILLVEDDASVRGLNARLLRAKGYAVIEAANGHEALGIADERADDGINLLLTDVVMPEIGGRELAQRFLATHPHTKVLFCSGYTREAIDRGGELEPGLAFLQKPFTPLLLARKVREVLDL